MARCFAQPHAAGYDSVIHGPVQMAPHLVGDLERQPGSTVEHRDHHSLDLETRVQRSPDKSDGIHQVPETLHGIELGLDR